MSSFKVVLTNARVFATRLSTTAAENLLPYIYANKFCDAVVKYLDKTEITSLDLRDAVYIYRTLQVHLTPSAVSIYYET